MATPPATIQQTQGQAVPIQALANPPDGQRAVQIAYTFVPSGLLTQGSVLQLNQPGGLALSQVVTLCIDNTANPNSVTVTHGVFNETITVEAGGYQVVPTFSTKSFYSIELTLPNAPATSVTVGIIFLNYSRAQFNVWSGASQVSNNNKQNTSSALIDLSLIIGSPPPATAQILGVTNGGAYYIITGFDVNIGDWASTSATMSEIYIQLGFGTQNVGFTIPIWQGYLATSSGFGVWPFINLVSKTGLECVAKPGQGLYLAAGYNNPPGQFPVGHVPILTANVEYLLITP